MSKYLFCLFGGLVIFLCSCGLNKMENNSSVALTKKHQVWQPNGLFPIDFWEGPPEKFNTFENWKTVAEAGFTSGECSYVSHEEEIKALKFCKKLNLPLLLRFPGQALPRTDDYERNKGKCKSLIKEYEQYSSFWGLFVGDEPVYRDFAWYERSYRILRELVPDKFIDSNLLAFDSFHHMGGGFGAMSYSDYLERYVHMVHPVLLSYDYYPLCEKKDRPYFFQNLEIARRIGLKYEIPVRTYLQTAPHFCPAISQSKLFGDYRSVSEEELRWQVYSSLAYGVKAFRYFTYWTFEAENYYTKEHPERLAIVDPQGRPTKLYESVKTINSEIRTLGKKLLELTSTDVFHTGKDIPVGCRKLGVDSLLWIEQDVPLILGFFKDSHNDDYAMIVNRDYRNSQTFEMFTAINVKKVTIVSANDGSENTVPLKDGKFKLTLTPGNGCLLHFKTEYEYPRLFIPHPVNEAEIKGIGTLTESKTVYVRKKINLTKIPENARIFSTAVFEYILYVNGERVGKGNYWYTGDGYDITRYLKAGENTIALEAYKGQGGGSPRIFVQIEITGENGSPEKIVTDKSWKISTVQKANWKENSFDDSKWAYANDDVSLLDFPYSLYFKGFRY